MLSGGGITRLLNSQFHNAPGYYVGGATGEGRTGGTQDNSGPPGDPGRKDNINTSTPVVTEPVTTDPTTPVGPTGPLPREFGSYDFSSQYPTVQPDFNQLMMEYQKQPESNSFNYAGTVYRYDPLNNFFTDTFTGLGITPNTDQLGSLGIAGLYG